MPRLAVALAALALVATPAGARPYTVDDLLNTEELGAAGFDPTGRWGVIERRGSLATATFIDGLDQTQRLASDLLLIDTAAAAPRLVPLPHPGRSGLIAGPFAPRGERLAVIGLSDDSAEVGVAAPDDRRIAWLGVTPNWTAYGQPIVWRSDHQLLVITREDGSLPPGLRSMAAPERRAEALRAAARRGAPSVTVNGSGAFTPSAGDNGQVLVSIDLLSGRHKVLARGDFDDMELSASGRYVALLVRAGDRPPRAAEPFRGGETLVRRELRILDLATGVVRAPRAGQNLGLLLMRWSPIEDALLVVDLAGSETVEGPRVLRVAAATGAVTAVSPRGLRIAPTTPLSTPSAGAVWLGAQPVVLAVADGDDRRDWFLVTERTATNLTSSFATPPVLAAATADRLLFRSTDGQLTAVDRTGRRTALAGTLPAPPPGEGGRRQTQAPALSIDDLVRAPLRSAGMEVLADTPQAALAVERTPDGARLSLRRDGASPVEVGMLNTTLAGIDFAVPIPVRHGPASAPLTSWLYRPASTGDAPLIVLPYPGAVHARPPAAGGGDQVATIANIQVLVAAGYAVLVPSLPPLSGPADPDTLTAQVDEAVSAAVGAGGVDAARIAIWGHSYGGYAALAIATRSHRYRAIIASAATSDLATSWARFSPEQAATPMPGLSLAGAGWAENGQARLGAPPWSAPTRYLAASPLYAADRISAPVLVVHGDADSVPIAQAQALFTALQRQGKDAQLLTYFGEGHVLAGPGNLRDLYDRVFAFLARTMAPRPDPPAAPGPASP